MPFTASVEWSSRSKSLQSRLTQKIKGVSHWLQPPVSPVAFGVVAPADVSSWALAKTTPLPVATDIATQSATVTVPDGVSHVRLDFELVATSQGHTATVLAFRQLFLASSVTLPGHEESQGSLMQMQFAIDDAVYVPSPKGPVRGRSGLTGFKTQLGLHPLLALAKVGQFSVNAEFVDVTELWWKVHPDTTWGWYWRPELKGRQEHLRVLAWTHGGDPMIWFAAIPDAAVGGSKAMSAALGDASSTPADIVFIRPPPGSNSIPYEPTQAGFETRGHDDVTLVNLARYLLSPIGEKTLRDMTSARLRSAELLALQVQPKATSPKIVPDDPMWLMKLFKDAAMTIVRNEAFTGSRANAFRPVGLEAAVNSAQLPHVLFLPLGFSASRGDEKRGIKAHPGGYQALNQPALKATTQSALTLLWSMNALGRDQPVPPDNGKRELWLAGHSEGNITVWSCLEKNGKDIDRIISFDANTLDEGRKKMGAAGKKRSKAKPLHAFIVMTPTNGGAAGLTDQQDLDLRALRDSNVLVTTLPDFDQRADYWHLNPPPIKNAYIRYVLDKWNVPQAPGSPRTFLDVSATTPGNWGFLFFHEMAVFGGELVLQTSTDGAPADPRVRTFFEMALSVPRPRPAK
jgi:hypothetical protein